MFSNTVVAPCLSWWAPSSLLVGRVAAAFRHSPPNLSSIGRSGSPKPDLQSRRASAPGERLEQPEAKGIVAGALERALGDGGSRRAAVGSAEADPCRRHLRIVRSPHDLDVLDVPPHAALVAERSLHDPPPVSWLATGRLAFTDTATAGVPQRGGRPRPHN